MKAVVLRHFGGPDALELLDWPEPRIGPGEVLVAVHAVSVGRTLDAEVRRRGADFDVSLPRILGSDPAGVVAAIGSAVSSVRVGDRVVAASPMFCGHCEWCRRGLTHACDEHALLGVHRDGGYAEYCAIPETSLARVPNHVTLEQAAWMGISYPTAWNLLRHAARVRAGDDVLVMAAGGAMGIAGTLIARSLGARVIAAAGAGWKLERCRELLGAEETVDYSEPGWSRRVRELSAGGDGVAVVFENISSPELFGEALSSLRRYGRLVTCGSHGGGRVEVDMRVLYRSHLTIAGEAGASRGIAREVFQRVADRELAPPPVFHRYPLAEAGAAHEASQSRDNFGRVVLVVREEA